MQACSGHEGHTADMRHVTYRCSAVYLVLVLYHCVPANAFNESAILLCLALAGGEVCVAVAAVAVCDLVVRIVCNESQSCARHEL